MKAPEKIYLNPALDVLIEALSEKTEDDVEYTRTDAFIEKAQEFFRQSNHLFSLDGMELSHFIDDFRKYMKGE